VRLLRDLLFYQLCGFLRHICVHDPASRGEIVFAAVLKRAHRPSRPALHAAHAAKLGACAAVVLEVVVSSGSSAASWRDRFRHRAVTAEWVLAEQKL
jgi:hypothetical protein